MKMRVVTKTNKEIQSTEVISLAHLEHITECGITMDQWTMTSGK